MERKRKKSNSRKLDTMNINCEKRNISSRFAMIIMIAHGNGNHNNDIYLYEIVVDHYKVLSLLGVCEC